MKTIVALVDHSEVTPKVLDQTHRLARSFGSRVVLINVLPETVVAEFGPIPLTPEERRMEQGKLFALRDSFSARGTSATAQLLQGNVVDAIVAKSRELAADVIVMGSHGHGAFYNLLVGSVTEGVLKRAPCPVLVVPSNGELREEATPDADDEFELDPDDAGFAND